MNKIINASLIHEAKEHKLDITKKDDFDKYVRIIQNQTPERFTLAHPNIIKEMLIIRCNQLINLNVFEKVHFKKTFSQDPFDANELFPYPIHTKMLNQVEKAKELNLDLFDEVQFNQFIDGQLKTIMGSEKTIVDFELFATLAQFSSIMFGKTFMNRELPKLDDFDDFEVVTHDTKLPAILLSEDLLDNKSQGP